MIKYRRRNSLRRRLGAERCEPRYCLSALAFTTHDIEAGDTFMATSVHAADLDGDGDLDLLSASSGDDKVAWYENTDGRGIFSDQQIITTAAHDAYDVYAADLDGDGDLDVISGSGAKITWYENLLPHAGDANRDGRFDTADLVQVLQTGEYEDNIEDNSTWEEGDWNGDGNCENQR